MSLEREGIFTDSLIRSYWAINFHLSHQTQYNDLNDQPTSIRTSPSIPPKPNQTNPHPFPRNQLPHLPRRRNNPPNPTHLPPHPAHHRRPNLQQRHPPFPPPHPHLRLPPRPPPKPPPHPHLHPRTARPVRPPLVQRHPHSSHTHGAATRNARVSR